MRSAPSTPQRCKILLNDWRNHLGLTNREKNILSGELKTLDRQIKRLNKKHIRIAAFGRVGVGKSSLLNALLNKEIFATDVAHGSTRVTKSVLWEKSIKNLKLIELVDTPGIDEIESDARARLAGRIAMQVDLVLFVLDSDITKIELEALEILLDSGKPVLLTLNRCDQWQASQLKEVTESIASRLPPEACNMKIQLVAAAPRKVHIKANGLVRSEPTSPRISPLIEALSHLLEKQGELLLALNALRQADHFYQELKKGRLKRSKVLAQGLIGKFAALKASSVAANPLLMLDLAGGLACDTALVMQLSRLYGLQMRGHAARKLVKHLSIYNALLGGVQVGVQLALGALRQLLILATPLTGGLSLASAAPIALAQAALAVHTTKITGRIAAQYLLKGSLQRGVQPRAMLQRLANRDPEVKIFLGKWQGAPGETKSEMQTLLP